jgi:glycosyltransferase involved in cell wall biosynthesis
VRGNALVVAEHAQPTGAAPFTSAAPGFEIKVERPDWYDAASISLCSAIGVSADDIIAAERLTADDDYMRALRACLEREPRAVVLPHPYLIRQLADLAPDVPVVYESQNVETVLKEGMYDDTPQGRASLRLVEDREHETCERARLVICASEEDREEMQRRFGVPDERLAVIPNGVHAVGARFTPWSERSEREPSCVFAGSGHAPNWEAARVIVAAAQLLPQVRFHMIGSVEDQLRTIPLPPNVEIHGLVPERMKSELFAQSTLALNPMISGSGTNLKIADYAAAGIPVLTSKVGARGYDEQLVSRFVLVEPDPGQLAEAIAESLEWDWSEAVAEARRTVEERYDWGVLAARYAELLRELS